MTDPRGIRTRRRVEIVVCMEAPVQNQQEADRDELYSIYGMSEVDSGLVGRLVKVANRTGLANYREFQPEKWASS
jgi:hypothetical protein